MNNRAISKHAYALGRFRFRIESCDENHLASVESAFQSAVDLSANESELLDISGAKQTLGEAIDIIRDGCFEHHADDLYIEGCAFLTPRNHRVLLLGLSHAGKTTLTAAAVLALNWRLVAEDTVIIDGGQEIVLSTPAPLSLRKTAPGLIEKATGRLPEPLLDGRWFPGHGHFLKSTIPQNFDRAIVLVRDGDAEMEVLQSTAEAILRHALTLSNALHIDDGSSRLFECVRNSRCLVVRNGTVEQRLAVLDELDRGLHDRLISVSKLLPA